ncbi:hypothetical protein H0A61_02055 [Koleobacter methoxysyntrophicus]|uniref:Uncharacterized protein n=2 Tax=Koleobacter methoxysyntrophicus TaxID=2751313 RepID=A0A8A0RR48_9FIRM|nr:hypothetical protein H0A61_02055 [Koleobacter methoxysyntrophicus]
MWVLLSLVGGFFLWLFIRINREKPIAKFIEGCIKKYNLPDYIELDIKLIPQQKKYINYYLYGYPPIDKQRNHKSRIKVYSWVDDDSLNLLDGEIDFAHLLKSNVYLNHVREHTFGKISIPIQDIITYSVEVESFNKVTGGGSSLGGAIVGSALAGGTGAIIGSRKTVESERSGEFKVAIKYKFEDKTRCILLSGGNIYSQLLLKIPDKEAT